MGTGEGVLAIRIGDPGMGTGEGELAIRIGDMGMGTGGDGDGAVRFGGGSVEKNINTGPPDVNRSCAVDA
jgi:hypothetical protein